jgi:hypothetical protein
MFQLTAIFVALASPGMLDQPTHGGLEPNTLARETSWTRPGGQSRITQARPVRADQSICLFNKQARRTECRTYARWEALAARMDRWNR